MISLAGVVTPFELELGDDGVLKSRRLEAIVLEVVLIGVLPRMMLRTAYISLRKYCRELIFAQQILRDLHYENSRCCCAAFQSALYKKHRRKRQF